EHHVSARRFDDAAAVALRAPALADVKLTGAAAGAAMLLPRHRDLLLAAAHGVLERDRHGVVQIDAALRLALFAADIAGMQDVGEQVAERGRRAAADAHREVEAFEAKRRRFDHRAHAARVVPPPPLRIAERL